MQKIKGIIKRGLDRLRGEISTKELEKKGLKVGKNFNRQGEVIIDYSHCWLVEIGDNVTLAPRVHILTHDASTKNFIGYTKVGNVIIGNNVFIGASSIVLPNVTIGDNVIVGAGSVVSKDVPNNVVIAGNPAKIISTVDEYLKKQKEKMRNNNVFDSRWTIKGNISDEMKIEMKEKLSKNIGFVE